MNFLLETPNTTELFTDRTNSFVYDNKQTLYMNTSSGNVLPNQCNGNYVENLPISTTEMDNLQQFDGSKTKQSKKSSTTQSQKQSRLTQKTEGKRTKSTAQPKSRVTDTQNPAANGISICHDTMPNQPLDDQPESEIQLKQPKKRGPKKKPLTKEREIRLKNRRVRANARERGRMHSLNHALELLRKHVPTFSTTQRLSKIETLRLAKNYIRTLSELLVKETPSTPLEMALTLTEGLSQNTSNVIASTLQVSPRALIQLQRQMNPHNFPVYSTDSVHNSNNPTANQFTSDWANDSTMYTNAYLSSNTYGQPNSMQSPLMISPLSSVTPPSINQTPPSYPISVMSSYLKPPVVEDPRVYTPSWANSYPHGFIPECDIGTSSFTSCSEENQRHTSMRQQQQHQPHQPEPQPQQYHSPMMLNNFQPLCILPLTNSLQRR